MFLIKTENERCQLQRSDFVRAFSLKNVASVPCLHSLATLLFWNDRNLLTNVSSVPGHKSRDKLGIGSPLHAHKEVLGFPELLRGLLKPSTWVLTPRLCILSIPVAVCCQFHPLSGLGFWLLWEVEQTQGRSLATGSLKFQSRKGQGTITS